MSIPESGVPNIETDELGARRSRARALVNGSEGERLPEFEREVLHRWANLGWNEDEINTGFF